MQQLFEGVYMLEGDVGGRPLQLMYLRGDMASILWDTGCTKDPERFILTQMWEAGGDPSGLTWIINSHPDLDHTGGNHLMKRLAPQSLLACGDADRVVCSGPEELMRLRYDRYRRDHGLLYDGDGRQGVLQQSGQAQPIETTFAGGEHIRLSSDWEVEIIALPGHARGHLGILDAKHQSLYGADAIHGEVYYGFDGLPKMPPTYLWADDYLATIRLIEHLPITTYVGCHWPIKRGEEIGAFCAESRRFVQHADHLLLAALAEPMTLRDACLHLGPALGAWPREVDLELMYALHANLESLVQRGVVSATGRDGQGHIVFARGGTA